MYTCRSDGQLSNVVVTLTNNLHTHITLFMVNFASNEIAIVCFHDIVHDFIKQHKIIGTHIMNRHLKCQAMTQPTQYDRPFLSQLD